MKSYIFRFKSFEWFKRIYEFFCLSFLQVAAVCREAALSAMQENIEIEAVHRRHFDVALATVTPRIGDDSLRFYETFAANSRLHAV